MVFRGGHGASIGVALVLLFAGCVETAKIHTKYDGVRQDIVFGWRELVREIKRSEEELLASLDCTKIPKEQCDRYVAESRAMSLAYMERAGYTLYALFREAEALEEQELRQARRWTGRAAAPGQAAASQSLQQSYQQQQEQQRQQKVNPNPAPAVGSPGAPTRGTPEADSIDKQRPPRADCVFDADCPKGRRCDTASGACVR
jgi:hypothetical protein